MTSTKAASSGGCGGRIEICKKLIYHGKGSRPRRLRAEGVNKQKCEAGGTAINLGLYTAVLRRHRWLVVIGLNLSLALALFSFVSVSSKGLSYRSVETWSNEATLALSRADRPEFRFDEQSAPLDPAKADFYATLATSDDVMKGLERRGLLKPEALETGKLPVSGTAVPSTVNAGPTPLLKISGTGTTPREATKLTIAAADELIRKVTADQVARHIPANQRLELRVLKRSGEPVLLVPRSKSKSIVIFLAGLTITIAAAFARENTGRGRQEEQADNIATLSRPDPPRRPREIVPIEPESRTGPPLRGPPADSDAHDHDDQSGAGSH